RQGGRLRLPGYAVVSYITVHGALAPGTFSSVVPSQSSSMPLHTSGPTCTPPEQTNMPLPQAHMPGTHTPMPLPHGCPMISPGDLGFAVPAMPSGALPSSSTMLSQSLSSPSHTSG